MGRKCQNLNWLAEKKRRVFIPASPFACGFFCVVVLPGVLASWRPGVLASWRPGWAGWVQFLLPWYVRDVTGKFLGSFFSSSHSFIHCPSLTLVHCDAIANGKLLLTSSRWMAQSNRIPLAYIVCTVNVHSSSHRCAAVHPDCVRCLVKVSAYSGSGVHASLLW